MAQSNYKSKVGNRKFNKGPKGAKPAVRKSALGAPVNVYTSVCCDALGVKKACVADFTQKPDERKAALGSWRCSNCKKKCKVTRKLAKDPKEVAVVSEV